MMCLPPFPMGHNVSVKLKKKLLPIFSDFTYSSENFDVSWHQLTQYLTALHTPLH